MPSININFINNLFRNYNKEDFIFIETGTYNGETIFSLEPYFNDLHTNISEKNIIEIIQKRLITYFYVDSDISKND